MDLKAFYRAELDEHAAVLRATLAQCEAPFLSLVEAAVKALEGGGKLLFFGNGGGAAGCAASRDRAHRALYQQPCTDSRRSR